MNKSFVLRWQSQVKKGTLTFIVLNILDKKGELYGYELIENVKDKTSIIIAEGTLYPLMNRLKKEKLVTSKWVEQESGIPRKYYSLTTTGQNTLLEMKDFWKMLEKSINTISK
ncbi:MULTISPECIES: PadR family transcriptional regulator [Flavobacteriaceae]|jgi:PadR family transcriptional regulator PadR|uniref:Putative transcriptional regulator n=1 Tax=Galbibacter orientalis DSM 19592 TaxID=926559 RepID=I3C0H6_9FLAO|nr:MULTISPECIES: PadR family transcriptional regulator [Flavobacteriaceae]EIJ37119.1 putative transcriptional regulator [Galbibacter orientalis DSM 19592]MCC4228537.1 PadR family transcriptional regulator [Zunongwangia profunda]|tara:strand:- start:570 stop:908 length:339 start_codon:yes stop_codon:yes gene_type:complete